MESSRERMESSAEEGAIEQQRVKIVPISRIVIDVCLLLAIGLPILFLFLWGRPFRRGFFCDDESIRHPFHPSTVRSYWLYVVGIGANAIVMVVTEYVTSPARHTVRLSGRWPLPLWLWNAYCTLVTFAFGCACSQLTTDIVKYTVGRLRPHFYSVCMPSVDCGAADARYKYFVDFECTNPTFRHDERIMKEMRLSFPSGHSSFAMFSMLFFAIYIHARMRWDGSKLLRHVLQYVALVAAVFTAMTRISDYKHHWSDVLAGMALGAVVATVVCRYVSDFFLTHSVTPLPRLVESSPFADPVAVGTPSTNELSRLHHTNGAQQSPDATRGV